MTKDPTSLWMCYFVDSDFYSFNNKFDNSGMTDRLDVNISPASERRRDGTGVGNFCNFADFKVKSDVSSFGVLQCT